MRPVRLIVLVLLLGLTLVACQRNDPVIDPGDGGNYTVRPDPSTFVERIDNPWLPFTPGSRWVYEDGQGERNEVVVTNQTREVMGITATVVTDTETRHGELVDQTADWFAHAREGNGW